MSTLQHIMMLWMLPTRLVSSKLLYSIKCVLIYFIFFIYNISLIQNYIIYSIIDIINVLKKYTIAYMQNINNNHNFISI